MLMTYRIDAAADMLLLRTLLESIFNFLLHTIAPQQNDERKQHEQKSQITLKLK